MVVVVVFSHRHGGSVLAHDGLGSGRNGVVLKASRDVMLTAVIGDVCYRYRHHVLPVDGEVHIIRGVAVVVVALSDDRVRVPGPGEGRLLRHCLTSG